jgi:monovalent cation:H+ antiporter-2, CPA2 family
MNEGSGMGRWASGTIFEKRHPLEEELIVPHGMSLVAELLVLLLAAIVIALVSSRLRQPVIVAFMLTGIIIGPYGLGLVNDVHSVEALAEIGVVLLLFTIGLEFSLKRMMEMRKLVLVGGGLQVILTIAAVAGLFLLFGRTRSLSIYFGFLFALSSTAIVLKTYLDRAEIDTPPGKVAVGVLIFQDLCIVPLMLFVPILSGREGSSLTNIATRIGTAILVIAAIIFTARKIVPLVLFHIVRLRSSEVFVLFVVLVSFGTAWLTSQFGLSMALGAFVAGVVLSESEYSHQIVSDFIPFRDVFNSIFFISIGMLLSMGFLITHLPTVLMWLVVLLLGKALIMIAVGKILGLSFRVSVMAGLALAQVGEFSFILAKVGVEQGLLQGNDYQSFLASSILSMIGTPFLISIAPRVSFALQKKLSWLVKAEGEVENTGLGEGDLQGHTIIVGYGNNGRNLARVLYRVGIPFIVLELNADTVQHAREQGIPIAYADAVRREVLQHFGVERARVMEIGISDPIATRHVVALAHEINPQLEIIVRTRYISQMPDLKLLGASQVVPEEFETSVEIFSRVLRSYSVSRNVIAREVDAIRSENYQMFRESSLPLAELDKIAEAFASSSTETVFVSEHSLVVGKSLKDLNLRGRTGVTVTAAVRDGDTVINLGPEFTIQSDDILVLLGNAKQLEGAVEIIDQRAVPANGAAELERA